MTEDIPLMIALVALFISVASLAFTIFTERQMRKRRRERGF